MRRFHTNLRRKLYRSRDGVILGVCKGIATYFDFSLFWTRAVAVMLLLLTGFWPVLIIYLIAGILMKPEPNTTNRRRWDSEPYFRPGWASHSEPDRIKRRFANLEHRIRHMEDAVTSKGFHWDARMRG
jgi:phage shock protein C